MENLSPLLRALFDACSEFDELTSVSRGIIRAEIQISLKGGTFDEN